MESSSRRQSIMIWRRNPAGRRICNAISLSVESPPVTWKLTWIAATSKDPNQEWLSFRKLGTGWTDWVALSNPRLWCTETETQFSKKLYKQSRSRRQWNPHKLVRLPKWQRIVLCLCERARAAFRTTTLRSYSASHICCQISKMP